MGLINHDIWQRVDISYLVSSLECPNRPGKKYFWLPTQTFAMVEAGYQIHDVDSCRIYPTYFPQLSMGQNTADEAIKCSVIY